MLATEADMARIVPGVQTIQNLKTDENRRQQRASKRIQKSYERLSLIKEFMNLPREMNADMIIAGVK